MVVLIRTNHSHSSVSSLQISISKRVRSIDLALSLTTTWQEGSWIFWLASHSRVHTMGEEKKKRGLGFGTDKTKKIATKKVRCQENAELCSTGMLQSA